MTQPVSQAPAVSAQTRHSIVLLACATFASMAIQRTCDAMLPALANIFTSSIAQAAQVVSTFAVVYGLAQLLHGHFGDRYGKFRWVTWATLGCSLASLLSALAGSLEALVAARMLTAFFAAAIIPMALAWIGDVVPYAQRQENLALTGIGTTLGMVSGQLLGGLMTDTLGWRWAFIFLTLLFLGVGFLLWRDLRLQGGATQGGRLNHRSRPPAATEPVAPSFLRQARLIVGEPWSRRVLLTALLEGCAGFGVLALGASHLHQALDLSLPRP